MNPRRLTDHDIRWEVRECRNAMLAGAVDEGLAAWYEALLHECLRRGLRYF